MSAEEQFYWCRRHERVEAAGEACAERDVLGPYPSAEAARDWKRLRDAREERWEEQDEEWEHRGSRRGSTDDE